MLFVRPERALEKRVSVTWGVAHVTHAMEEKREEGAIAEGFR